MGKSIVVLSDEAAEGGPGEGTNVRKLFGMLLDRSPGQLVFYDSGQASGRPGRTGRIGGLGISRSIKQGYEFVCERFEAGDRIHLLGSGLGAAAVRSQTALIEHFGILPRSRRELVHEAYEIYRYAEDEYDLRLQAADFARRHHTIWTRVRFLGVWDAVWGRGPTGFPSLDVAVDRLARPRFHHQRLSPCVDVAVQALAIDEERRSFAPQPWDAQIEPGQVLRQVWFAGSHADIAGGHAESGLSDIALEWMLRHAVDAGLELYPRHQRVIKANPDGALHPSRVGLGALSRRLRRSWPDDRPDLPTVHQSVIDRYGNRENGYEPWILTETEAYDVEPW